MAQIIPKIAAEKNYLAARRALSRVFQRSIVIVIGPTPPGTGVIAEATLAHDS